MWPPAHVVVPGHVAAPGQVVSPTHVALPGIVTLHAASHVAFGGHVVKCGLGPVVIDLMQRGFITAVAMHGATAIHDYEISLVGQTSEDVAGILGDGSFGMPAAISAAG